MGKEFFNINELSEYLGIKKSTLYGMVEGKEIPCFRFGRLIRFKKEEIDTWIEGHREKILDPNKKATEIMRRVKSPAVDVERIIKKTIEEAKGSRYNLGHGKSDRIRGLGKEVEDGTL